MITLDRLLTNLKRIDNEPTKDSKHKGII